jgi:hypothetical protein
MVKQRTKKLPDIHKHPAFRALVDELRQQKDEQINRCMECLVSEQEKEDSNVDESRLD